MCVCVFVVVRVCACFKEYKIYIINLYLSNYYTYINNIYIILKSVISEDTFHTLVLAYYDFKGGGVGEWSGGVQLPPK